MLSRLRHLSWPAALLMAGLSGLALLMAAAWLVGSLLSQPDHQPVGAPPADWPVQTLQLPTDEGGQVRGWFAKGQPGHGAVLLLHGVYADRLAMLARARMLHRQGYSVCLIDLPAHGESSGERISFGMAEGAGVRAAMAYVRQQLPGEKVAVIGTSLGGAALLLSHVARADAVVLESVFPDIRQAIDNRVRAHIGWLADVVTPLLAWQLPLRLHLELAQLRPIDYVKALGAPVLIAAGLQDRHTTPAETRELFDAAREPKALWMVEGAAHVDLYDYAPKPYELRVLGFLDRYLGH
ncbi:alpha/beta hydrolase [Delftia acidovorans]|uniref:Esterase n=1 Tax=Chryseobacterium sp. B5 TaxID=2050562 RepID=A0A2G7SUN8_9FLAO|nr:alpha/beta hydrolase [Delftia acidovorans]